MRSIFLATLLCAFLSPMLGQAQQAGAKVDIEISSAVLKTAEWASFKYMENLDLAQSGDQQAIKSFLDFSRTVDGTEALEHATTCLELIPLATDEKIGSVISILKPKLISVLLDRFQLAQGRTQKEALRKPMQEWAPLTWKALHGERVTCSSCMHKDGALSKKPPVASPNNQGIENADSIAPSGKQ